MITLKQTLDSVTASKIPEGIRMEMDKFTCSDNTRMNWLKKGTKMLEPLMDLLKLNSHTLGKHSIAFLQRQQ